MQQNNLLVQTNSSLENSFQERSYLLQYVKIFADIVAKIRASMNLETMFQTTNRKICELLQIERLSVYCFNSDWSGEFVENYEFISPNWERFIRQNCTTIWEDTHFQETRGGRYRHNETFAVDDIYQANHSPCHVEILEYFYIKAYAIAPIFVGKKLWGLFAAYQLSEPRHWEESEVQFLHQIAEQIGFAIQKDELITQVQDNEFYLQKIAQQRQILSNIVAQTRTSLNLETMFQTTSKKVCELLEAERVAVYRFNSDWSGEFVENYEFIVPNWESSIKQYDTTIWDDTHLQETQGGRYRRNETFAVDDIYELKHSPCYIQLLEQFYIKAYAIAPIFVGKQLWGLFAVYQLSQPRHWEEYEVQFLHQVADQLGLAAQKTELFAQTQQEKFDSEKALKQKQILSEITANIRKSVNLETIFQSTNKEVCELLEAERVTVYCFNSDWGGEFLQNYEFISPNWKNLIEQNNITIWDDTCLQETQGGRYLRNETFAVDDIYKKNHSPCYIQLLEQFYIKAYAIAPIFVGNKLWGLLAAYQLSEPRHWEESEVQFLHQVAEQFSLVLQQADWQKLAERYHSLSDFLLKKGQFSKIVRQDI
ncbi:MAG: GAF domain-containing protein [Cyanobacteria bacterium P01_A01_bin.68]